MIKFGLSNQVFGESSFPPEEVSLSSNDLISYHDIKPLLENNNGAVRLRNTRAYFGLCKYDNVSIQSKKLTDLDIEFITSAYKDYRDLIELLPMRITYESNNPKKEFVNVYGKTIKVYDRYEEWVLVETVKRGNKKYCDMVKKRLDPLTKKEPIEFF